jgi:beta-phosphoglucomutase-like phosphatase (HAD superfamily)
VYDNVIGLVEAAMRADRLASEWPTCILTAETVEDELAQRIAAKRLTDNVLKPLLQALEGGNGAVLEQITDPDQLAASELDRKLVAAGVLPDTRAIAKQLRANTSRAVFESGTGLEPADRHLQDLDLRVLARATAVAGTIEDDPPGPTVYRQVMDDLGTNRDAVDPNRLLSRDPMLIFGRLCDLSDRCQFEWRAQ